MSRPALPHAADESNARRSAEVVVPRLLELTGASSVVDVGCGTGAWLSVFAENGVERYLGLDGAYVRSELTIPADRFVAVDLAEPVNVPGQFDLVVSLEVAEHLPAAAAPTFVSSLTRLGAVVAFSAAAPHQPGPGHVNCQWPDYWHALFSVAGFSAADSLRDALWNDSRVSWWYRQNLLIFGVPGRLRELGLEICEPRCMARPELIESVVGARRRSSPRVVAGRALRRLARTLDARRAPDGGERPVG